YQDRVAIQVHDPADNHLAVGRRDLDSGILVADDLAWLDDGFEQVAHAEAPRQTRQVRAHRSALVVEAVTDKALRLAEQPPAAIEVALRLQSPVHDRC